MYRLPSGGTAANSGIAATFRSARLHALLAALALLAAAAAAGLLSPLRSTPAHAVSGTFTEYTPPTQYGTPLHSLPVDIVAGPDGNMWFSERNGQAIGKITLAGLITEFQIPTAGAIPDGMTVGPDGWIWFCESQQVTGKVGKINPADGTFQEYAPLADPGGCSYLTTGPDGNVWFTERRSDATHSAKIGKITPAGVITEYPIAPPGANPRPIHIISAAGALWFAEQFHNKIVRITTDGVITEYPVPTADTEPSYLALGPDGNIWFTEYGCVSNAGGSGRTCNPGSPPEPGNRLAYINPGTGVITELPVLPTNNSRPAKLLFDPAGNIWFTEQMGNALGQRSAAGVVSEAPVPSAMSLPTGIARASDGSIWFTEFYGEAPDGHALGGKIGKFVPGVGTLMSAPGAASWGASRLDLAAVAANGQVWHRSRDSGTWAAWENLEGNLTSDPAAVSWGPGRLDIFGRSATGSLAHRTLSGGVWSPWEDLGGQMVGGPGATSWGPGRIDVVVRGVDNQLYHRCFCDGSWSPFVGLGGGLSADPAITAWGPGRLDVFVRGMDNSLFHRCWCDGWSDWEWQGGLLTSAPDSASWGEGRIDVFVRSTGNQLWQKCWCGGSWSGWVPQGGNLASRSGTAAPAFNRLEVFARGPDNQVLHKTWNGGTWSAWVDEEGPPA